MRIVLLGPPGSGKAALSQQISAHYGMPVITVGSVMRRAAAEHGLHRLRPAERRQHVVDHQPLHRQDQGC